MMRENPQVYKSACSAQPPQNILKTIMAGRYLPQPIQLFSSDIPRTFPENTHFSQAQGKGDLLPVLQRILFAFAITFPQIGYCQVG